MTKRRLAFTIAGGLAGLALGALAASLPDPWPIVVVIGLVLSAIGLAVQAQRELRRSRAEFAALVNYLAELQQKGGNE